MKINLTKQSGIYTLTSEQVLPLSLEKAWEFFTFPANLDKITPPEMEFRITNNPPAKTYKGQIITYKIGILPGISSNWITEITHLEDKEFFVDEQRFGPYAMWHHKHFLKEIPGGVEVEDVIDYKIPLGILGQLVHPILVKPKLNEIFAHREKKLIELFGEFKEQ